MRWISVSERFTYYTFFGSFVVSVLLSIPFSLLFESPFLQIERLILFPEKKNENKLKKNESNDRELLSLDSKSDGEKRQAIGVAKINESSDTTELRTNE